MKKVAAIVSAYFASAFIKGRIENLLTQSIKPLVVVVAEQDSAEHHIVEKLFGGNPDVQLILSAGIPTVYSAWNTAIKFSESEYITNANSDDRLYAEGLTILSKSLDKDKKCDVAYPDVHRVYEIDGPPFGSFVWSEGGLQELLKSCFIGPMPMWRRSVHEVVGMFNETYTSAGDYEFWLRCASNNIKFKHVHSFLGAHLEREDALEHRSPIRSMWETARIKSTYRS